MKTTGRKQSSNVENKRAYFGSQSITNGGVTQFINDSFRATAPTGTASTLKKNRKK